MIGMMYLVLTAMLALNVSSEILNGFTMVDNSLHTTIESSQIRNDKLYADFKYLNEKNPEKVKAWLDTAMIVKKQSDELYEYIENFKRSIVKIADEEKADPNSRVIIARDNLDASGEYALLKGNGKILKKKINDYSDFLVGLSRYSKEKQDMYKTMFATKSYESLETKEVKPWEYAIFEMMPVAAVVTILTKYQSDIRSSEAEMVQYLKLRTDEKDERVNRFDAMVIPNSKFVFKGEKYSAKIVLSAIDTTKVPKIVINGSPIKVDKYGIGTYEFIAGGKLGPNKYSGYIQLGEAQYPIKDGDYVVNEPSVNISNLDLNILYKGIDHNFTVSVPNVAPENVQIKVDGATSTSKGKGKYVIRATRDGNVTINVVAKIGDKMMNVGSEVFRVKKLPPPTTYILDSKGDESLGGFMTIDQLRGASLIASYGPDALIQAKFRISSFTMLVDGLAPKDITNTRLDVGFLNKLSRGKTLVLSNVVAVGPDNNPQTISSIVVRLQ